MGRRRTFGTIIRTETGAWRAFYVRNYRKYYAPGLFPTKTHADQWLATIQLAIATGTWTPPGQPLDPQAGARNNRAEEHEETEETEETSTVEEGLSFGAYIEQWLDRKQAQGLAAKTTYTYRVGLGKWIGEDLAAKPLAALTREDFRAWYSNLSLSPSGMHKAYTRVRSVLATATEEGLIAENPCHIPGAAAKPRRNKRNTVATIAQVERIAAQLPADLQILPLLGFWCALRYGEAVELRRKDIDLEAGTVSVSRAFRIVPGAGHEIARPKTEAGVRTIAIPPNLLGRLAEHMNKHVARGMEALIVHSRLDPRANLRNNTFMSVYRKAVEAAAPELGDFDFHCLRHSGLTLFAQAGATTAELQARAGHATAEMVAVYQHATRERDRTLAARMGTI